MALGLDSQSADPSVNRWRRELAYRLTSFSIVADIREIPGDFEARIALLAGLGNGKLPRRGQEAIEAAS